MEEQPIKTDENKPVNEVKVETAPISPPVEQSEIEKAEQKIKQLDLLNAQLKEKLAQVDRIQAEVMLRGRGLSNVAQETDEERKNKEALKLIEGTGLRIKL
jgi:hypothetical protein